MVEFDEILLDMALEFRTPVNVSFTQIHFSRVFSTSIPYPKFFGGEQF